MDVETIIHQAVERVLGRMIHDPFVPELIADLQAAGYRILPPGALDPETLEVAAECADRAEVMNTHKRPGVGEGRAFAIVQAKIDISRDIAAAIRAMKG